LVNTFYNSAPLRLVNWVAVAPPRSWTL
jgi:hypothetical protein